jgi:hypothetical protein
MNILGPCCCACDCVNSVVARYDNVTTVPDYITGGTVRNPYPRPSGVIACTDLCGATDEPPCGPWNGDLPECESGTTRDHNCYAPAGETVEIDCCGPIGWKAVQAVKTWHGRWGFGHGDGCTEILGEPGDGECNGCVYSGPQSSPPTTKYRTMTRALVWHKEIDLDGTVQNNDIAVDLSATVNRYSGVKSYNSCSGIYTVDGVEQADWQTGGGDPQVLWLLTQLEVDCHGVFTVQYSGVLTANLNIYLEAINQVSRGETPTGPYPWDTLDVDWSETGCTIHGIRYFGNATDFEDWTLTVEFTDAYTSAAVVQDIKDMLGQWDLSNKCQHPWRTDDLCGLVPIVRYDEFVTPQNPDPVGQICPDNVPPTPDEFPTGELYGAPNPIGYDRHFQFRHENYVWLPDSSVWCLESYGYESPPELPATTTEWTTALEAALTRRGGWMEFNTQGRLYAQKSADLILKWPSMNFARPCGGDATTVDPDTIDCDTNPDGDLRWPDAPECGGAWNTDASRRNYVFKEWTFNLRAAGESQRLHDNWELCYGADCFPEPTIITETVTGMTCTDFTYPQMDVGCIFVACITPNTESWEHGRNHTWNTSFVCDEKYGSKWMGLVQQAMIDPLWKRPRIPCPDGSIDTEAVPPYVEARCTLPLGAPALPEGIDISCSIATCRPEQAEDCDFDFLHWTEFGI